MEDYKRTELLVKVAKLYYEHGYSQDMVAKAMNLSRPYISKLLNEAKEAGIVRIEVIDPVNSESLVEKKLMEAFQLDKVIAVPAEAGENLLPVMGREAARYLNSIIKSGDIIGVSWGETVYHCSRAMERRRDLENITVVQLCGGITNLSKNIYATEVTRNISAALGGTSYSLPLPAVVDDGTLKKIMLQDRMISTVNELGERANIALFTMGAFGLRSALVRAEYLTEGQMAELGKMGAVGDVCSHVIDIEGRICDASLDARTIATPLENIKAKEHRIGVAMGLSKVECICGALRAGLLNVLITTEETAGWVMERMKLSCDTV